MAYDIAHVTVAQLKPGIAIPVASHYPDDPAEYFECDLVHIPSGHTLAEAGEVRCYLEGALIDPPPEGEELNEVEHWFVPHEPIALISFTLAPTGNLHDEVMNVGRQETFGKFVEEIYDIAKQRRPELAKPWIYRDEHHDLDDDNFAKREIERLTSEDIITPFAHLDCGQCDVDFWLVFQYFASQDYWGEWDSWMELRGPLNEGLLGNVVCGANEKEDAPQPLLLQDQL